MSRRASAALVRPHRDRRRNATSIHSRMLDSPAVAEREYGFSNEGMGSAFKGSTSKRGFAGPPFIILLHSHNHTSTFRKVLGRRQIGKCVRKNSR